MTKCRIIPEFYPQIKRPVKTLRDRILGVRQILRITRFEDENFCIYMSADNEVGYSRQILPEKEYRALKASHDLCLETFNRYETFRPRSRVTWELFHSVWTAQWPMRDLAMYGRLYKQLCMEMTPRVTDTQASPEV